MIIPWPPKPDSEPPKKQYEIGHFCGWDCICSHLEPQPDGSEAPHYVVDWMKQPKKGMPYPFLPSAVPSFLQDVWFVNAKENKKHVTHNIAELCDKYWGMPIYVVGTGPSLWSNMDALRDVDEGIIITTNNAINILPDDVKIDYYCCVDGRLPKRWWSDCRKDVKVISVPLVTPYLAEQFGADNIYWARFAGNEGPNRCFDGYDLDCLEPGYVCGFSAINAAFYMGGNPIVLVGMDCCLKDGYLHAGDLSKAYSLPGEQYMAISDMYNKPQVTSSTYIRGMWKIAAAAKLNGRHRWFINATEGGCLREHVSCIPLNEVVSWEHKWQ